MSDPGGVVTGRSLILICHSYPPVLGGSEIEAQRVCSALLKRGYRVQVLCAGGAPMPAVKHWVDPEGVPVRIWGNGLPYRWCGYTFAAGVAWTLFRKRREYDIVYFLMAGLQIATGMPVARALRKPIVMKFSGSGVIAPMMKTWLGRLELGFVRRWASRLLLLNAGMMGEAEAAGLRTDRAALMPNPVDVDRFAPASVPERARLRRELAVENMSELIVFVGRLAPEKELPVLIGAFARTLELRPDAMLAVIGEGEKRAELEDLSRSLGVESKIRFTGRQSQDDVRRWLRAGDAFALVSSLEGMPCSLIEAMSAGLAPVVSDIPANRQLVDHEQQGLVAPLGDEAAIAKQLVRVLEDRQLRARMSERARERVARLYSTGVVVDQYERLFGEVMAPGGRGSRAPQPVGAGR